MTMAEITRPERFRPSKAEEVADIVAWAAAEPVGLEVVGAGSKQGFGRSERPRHALDVGGLAGISLYEPAELVLTAAAGTAMRTIEAELAANNQLLAFEPPDLGPFYGTPAGQATLGGVVACNLSGPRRLKAGAARDHLLGVAAVNGRGEVFKTGGRVVKNVTGYDLCKLLAGSHGTLAVMTALTFKALPAPEKVRTVLLYGLDDAGATAAMTAALNSSHEVSGAAHLPPPIAATSAVDYVAGGGKSVTALRLEGVGPSVAARCEALRGEVAPLAPVEELHRTNSARLWAELRDLAPFAAAGRYGRQAVWRLSLPPQVGHRVAAAILGARAGVAFFDWGGGLVWLALASAADDAGDDDAGDDDAGDDDAGTAVVRAAVAPHGGHATLMRAAAATRAAVAVFQPPGDGLASLTERVKGAFDPRRVLNPGRMYAGV